MYVAIKNPLYYSEENNFIQSCDAHSRKSYIALTMAQLGKKQQMERQAYWHHSDDQ